MARHPARADYGGYYVSAHAAVKATVAAEQKRHVSVRVVLNGGRHVVDLNIAGRLADISRAGLATCRRSRRCSGDRYLSSTRRQQQCDVGQFDSHGRAPLHLPFVATETSQPLFIPTVGDLVRSTTGA